MNGSGTRYDPSPVPDAYRLHGVLRGGLCGLAVSGDIEVEKVTHVLAIIGGVLSASVFLAIFRRELFGLFVHTRWSPQESADLANQYDLTRGCNNCGSVNYRYDLASDLITCTVCGSHERTWVLAHPEMSK